MKKTFGFHLIYPHETRNKIASLEMIYRATHLWDRFNHIITLKEEFKANYCFSLEVSPHHQNQFVVNNRYDKITVSTL